MKVNICRLCGERSFCDCKIPCNRYLPSFLEMAEFVHRRKEKLANEVPLLHSHFRKSTVKRILNYREKFEYRLMRRDKQKSDFTDYIKFVRSVIKKVAKMELPGSETQKLIQLLTTRTMHLYQSALKYFQDDVSLWKDFIKFLIKYKRIYDLQKVLDSAVLLHGHISDEIFVFGIRQQFHNVKNVQKTRAMYTTALHIHKTSSALYLEAFKCEIASAHKLRQSLSPVDLEDEAKQNDPALNGSIAKLIFESAIENVKNDSELYFNMYREAIVYDFASNLADEIKKYMLMTFSQDPNYWDNLATSELVNSSTKSEKLRIKNCLTKYDEALTLHDTEVMWDKYLDTVINFSSDTPDTEEFKRSLLRESMLNAHKKKKLKPIHYIKWLSKSSRMISDEVMQLALQTYPNDPSILEIKIKHLIEVDKASAYEFFTQNISQVSPSTWLIMVTHLSDQPQIEEIFNKVFDDKSNCPKEVKQQLGNDYLSWLSKNKSLIDARVVYNKLILDSAFDASLCKTIVTIETEQENIDIMKIRQHYVLASMQFGKTDIDFWMDRIYFELKYGSPKFVSTTYHQALTTLNNKESDKFVEEYTLKVTKLNQPE